MGIRENSQMGLLDDHDGGQGRALRRYDETGKTRKNVVNYIDVESAEKCSVKIEKAGGKILVPKTPIKGWGYYAIFKDTENNVMGIWENDESAK
jgi:predicted enzyme related to lactoylglutathione lyase